MLDPMARSTATLPALARPSAAVAAVVLAPWALRALALRDEGLALTAGDLRGFGADLAVGLLVLAALWPLARIARWLAVTLVGALAVAYYANYETIGALGSVASPLDARFLASSASRLEKPRASATWSDSL